MREKCYAIGVDIGGTNIKIGLFLAEGRLLSKWEFPTDISDSGVNILPSIREFISLNLGDIEKDKIIGIGVGVPGPVDFNGTVFGCVNLGWGEKNIKEELTNLLKLPVKVENDANLAALGEMWQGAGKDYKNLALITIGTGIGGGIVANGKILSGRNGGSGEIGHLTIRIDEKELCSCGKTGCVEQYGSATAMVKIAKDRIEKIDGIKTDLFAEGLTAKTIFEEAKKRDLLALEIVEEMGKAIGMALSHVAGIFAPDIILVGGGVAKAGTIVIDAIQKYYEKYVFYVAKDAPIKLGSLGNDAGIYGGTKMVID